MEYLTVSAINKYIKYRFDTDEHLKNVFLKGEISNIKPYSSGHMYFTIKDETSRISAVMFSNSTKRLSFVPKDGMKVLVIGRISIYEGTGNYQIYIEDMQEDGIGNLHIAFEKLKESLAKEGLFDPSHKRPIPKIPNKIGIVTAPNGAAIKDILTTLKRRFPLTETILFPSLVQGDSAAEDIVKNINLAQSYDLDVLIVGRGGGSIEDLWPFNEEIVARAIYNSKIPIISAVGHEIDYTISDFVADLRAPTPTGAAELAVPNYIEVLSQIEHLKIRSSKVLLNQINHYKHKLDNLKNNYILKNPANMYQNKQIQIDNNINILNNFIDNLLQKRINQYNHLIDNYTLKNPANMYQNKQIQIDNNINILNNIINYLLSNRIKQYNYLISNYTLKNPLKLIEKNNNRYIKYTEKLEVLNPLNTLKRGYTITKKDDKAISSIKNIKLSDSLNILFNDGTINVDVKEIKEN